MNYHRSCKLERGSTPGFEGWIRFIGMFFLAGGLVVLGAFGKQISAAEPCG
jgi:hypothetical protein